MEVQRLETPLQRLACAGVNPRAAFLRDGLFQLGGNHAGQRRLPYSGDLYGLFEPIAVQSQRHIHIPMI